MSEYSDQAKAFLESTNTKLTITKIPEEAQLAPDWDGPHGHEYRVKLERSDKAYVFSFWGSYHNKLEHKRPTAYDVLACLDTFVTPELSFPDFAAEFGYEMSELERAQRTYDACLEQTQALQRLFNSDELAKLEEIQ